jgi:hypothetical protein
MSRQIQRGRWRQQIHMSEKYQILFYWLPLYYYLYVICTIFLYQYSIRVASYRQ